MSEDDGTYEDLIRAEANLSDAIRDYTKAKSAAMHGPDVTPEIVTHWVLVVESAFADGDRGISQSASEGLTEWQMVGMLEYLLMSTSAHMTLDVLTQEMPEDD